MHPATFHETSRTSAAPRIVAVIPARYQSTRLPGKPLADLDGRPMIEHVYRRAAAVRGIQTVIVATDDARVRDAVAAFGGTAVMTAEHQTGTDRIAEVAREVPCDIVVNVQGDEPLIEPAMIEQAIAPLQQSGVPMATLRRRIDDDSEFASPHVVKVVVDRDDNALYFSRSPIPALRQQGAARFKHIGLYAYRRDFLLQFASLPQTPLERAESLEQLRALEHGFRIQAPETQYDSIGVDTPEDLERVRRQLRELAAAART